MRRPLLIAALALAAGIAVCYAPGLHAPPTFDTTLLLDSPKTSSTALVLKGFLNPNDPFRAGYDYAYRPLTELSFSLNWALTPSLGGLRAGNLLLHLGVCLLVFVLARELGAAAWVASRAFPWLAAFFFALHPMTVQAAGYVYQRSTVLAALFAFLAMRLYLRASPWPALAAALLAALSKETGATLPLSLAALAWILRGRTGPGGWRRWWPFCLPPLLVLVQVIRANALSRSDMGNGVLSDLAGRGPWEYLEIELPVVWHYLRLAAWPWPLHFEYEVWPHLGRALAAGAGLLVLLGWILFGPERHRLPRLGAALFFAPLAMESSVFPIKDVAFNHRCYPGLLGAALLFAWGACALPRGAGLRWASTALLLLGGLTFHENRVWSSTAALCVRDVRCTPDASQMRGVMARRAVARGELTVAERRARLAVRCRRQSPDPMIALAEILTREGKDDEALACALKVARAFPRDADSLYEALLCAEVLARRTGDWTQADDLAARATTLGFRGNWWTLRFAGRLADMARRTEAEEVLRAGLARAPDDAALWECLGTVLVDVGRLGEAEQACQQALALDLRRPRVYHTLACIRAAWGDLEGAERMLREALRLNPGYRKAADDLEQLLRHRGRRS